MRRKTVGNKVVSVLLAGALAASLAACGGNTANTGADAGNNAADAGTKEDTKSEKPKPQQIRRRVQMQQWLTVATRQRI
mgnify:CR=1 FL=1